MKAMVYVAGPYTSPDPGENTHKAIHVATRLLDSGFIAPVVPHLSMLWHTVTPRPYATWLELDRELIRRCDALLRMPGESAGADLELECALAEDIAVFTDVPRLLAWAEDWTTWDREARRHDAEYFPPGMGFQTTYTAPGPGAVTP